MDISVRPGKTYLNENQTWIGSVMNVSTNGLHSSVPTDHDYETVRAIYAHTD